FGSGMFAISLLGLFFGHLEIFVPLFVLVCFPTEIFICIKDRKHFSFKKNYLYILLTIPFIILGSYLLTVVPSRWPLVFLGVVIVTLAIYFLSYENKIKWQFKSPKWQIPFGSLSGLMGSVYGIGGPPLIIYLKGLKLTKREFRAMCVSVFFAMSVIRLPAFLGMGLLTHDIMKAWFFILPFSLLGVFIGHSLHKKLSEKRFKRMTSAILLINGLLLIAKNLL
ncbi:sulfite exporter TauE/SafE family protein, partial [bacterium]|nr:sulfite exporter TauE/SafE family protein [bacterium]MBU1918164.1 sulfite exporter TauE/SafE family protein [bacterium]